MRVSRFATQIVNNQTLEALKRTIAKTIAEATPQIQAAKNNQVKILSKRFSEFNDWYMKITGLDKVNLAQEKVTALQDQLLKIQEKRRDVGRQLADIRQRSMELQDEIHKVKRQEDLEKFLDLMKKETEVLKLERSISKTFQDYDQTERELFTAFTDSIRDSHEKQRAQMEYTKYFGIVLSIAGSFLAFVYSTLRKEQLKQIIDERLQTLETSAGDNNNNINNSETFAAHQLIDLNKKIIDEMATNRQRLDQFKEIMLRRIEQLQLQQPAIQVEKVANDLSESDNGGLKSFVQEHGSYLQAFGTCLGMWLILKAFTS